MRFRGIDPTAVAAPLAWVAQPFLLGPLLADALDPTEESFRRVAGAGAWVWWFLVLVALVVPRPITLSIGRIGAAAALPAAVWAGFESDSGAATAVGLAGATVAATIPLLPAIGERFVDGESYGDERRFLLRPPGPALVALVVPTWAATVAGVVTGPLLLADSRWVVGALALAAGVPISLAGFGALHRLTRRFLVFVPNGLVVHDRGTLREPVLFVTREISGFAPAADDSAAVDLTSQALGLALELRLSKPAELPIVTGRALTEDRQVRSMLIAPTRPAAVLALAADRGFPIA